MPSENMYEARQDELDLHAAYAAAAEEHDMVERGIMVPTPLNLDHKDAVNGDLLDDEEIEEETMKQRYMRWVREGEITFGACAECGNYVGAEWAEYDAEEFGYRCVDCRTGDDRDFTEEEFYEEGDYPERY